MKKLTLLLNFIFCLLISSQYLSAQSIHLDGVDDHITIPKVGTGILNGFSTPHDFTVEILFEFHGNTSPFRKIFSNNASGSGIFIETNPSGKIQAGFGDGGWKTVNSNITLVQNTQYHAAMVYDATNKNLEFYMDGVLIGTSASSATGLVSNTHALAIGYSLFWTDPAAIIVEYTRIWDDKRTSAEIDANKNIEVACNEANLLLQYTFDDGIANGNNSAITTVSDCSANGLDGTLNNFALTGNGSNFYQGVTPLPAIAVKHDATGANDGSSWTDAYTDLQDAIDAANPGDEIWVAEGTYFPTRDDDGVANNRDNTFYISKDDIKIYGGFNGTETSSSQRNASSNVTTLSGDIGTIGDSTDNVYKVLHIQPAVSNAPITSATVIDGFTIEEANADSSLGSAMLFRTFGSSTNEATISNCIIKDNFTSYNGAGANVYFANPTFYNCTFSNNRMVGISGTSFSKGGAIFLFNTTSQLKIKNCTFEGNSADRSGGGIHLETAAATIDSCLFSNNNSRFQGGAINASSTTTNDTLKISNSIFTGNSSTSSSGGAIYKYASQGSFMTVNNCYFTENRASSGGAVYMRNNSGFAVGAQFNDCTFTNNHGGGSALFFLCQSNANMQPEFNNCLMYDNRTSFPTLIFSWAFNGGNVQPRLNNCTIAGNSETSALLQHSNADPFYNNCIIWGKVNPITNSPNNLPTFTNSLVKGGGSDCWSNTFGINNGGNIDFDPMFLDTMNGDFSLMAGSPAINVGSNDSIVIGNTSDIVGNPRLFDVTVDLGAYEYQAPLTLGIAIDSISITNPQCPADNGTIVIHASGLGDAVEYSNDNGTTWQDSNTFTVGVGSYDLSVRLKNNTSYERIYSCPVTLSASDNTPPVATAQNVTIYLNNSGNATLIASNLDNGSTDNCDANLSFSTDKTSFDCSNLGANTVSLIATDDDGNADTTTAMVTVMDTISPTASASGTTIFLDASGNTTLSANQINNGSSDVCDANPSLSINKTAFTCADLGTNNVTLTVTDASGNFSTNTVTVTVSDNVAPTPVAQNINAYLNANGQATVIASALNNGSTDNCQSALTYSLDINSFNCNDLGANTVTFTATDAFGNANSTSATITIIDTVSPVVQTQNFTVNLNTNGQASISTIDIDNGTTDNCTANPTLSLSTTNFTCADLGSNTVTLTATDVNGNTSSQTATVTVIDNVAPVVVVQNAIAQLDANGQASISIADIDNGSNDACDTNPALSLDMTNFTCADLGNNTVTLTVTDTSGNSNSLTATVTVLDNVIPVMATQDITIQLDANGQASITTADIDNGTSDNCDATPALSLNITTFDCSNIGTNTVTLTATDASGNTNTQTAVVTVEDNVVPNISADDLVIFLNENGEATLAISDVNYAVSDNCDPNPALTIDISSFSCNDLGENTVTIIATDAQGNSNDATFTVTVIDEIAPTITCQPFEWSVDASGVLDIDPFDLIADVADNCNYTVETSPAQLTVEDIGENVVTVTAIDDDGNTAVCQSVVTVLFDCIDLHSIVTPNGDGKNDTWSIECIGSLANEVTIFNDLGQAIFNQTNYIGNWDGRSSNGEELAQGVYYYIIKVIIRDRERLFRGNITVLR